MNKFKLYLKKEELSSLFSLYAQQNWLLDREDKLLELMRYCDTAEQKRLVIDLLHEFHFLDVKTLSAFLNLIADFITNDSGFNQNTTQIAAITYDDEADSSQKVLDYLKIPIFQHGWTDLKTVNKFGATIKNHSRGRTQIIFVDEFVGSGSTIIGRIKQLRNDIKDHFELKFCFIAGMEHGLKKIEAEGFEVFCPLRIRKGIREKFTGEELEQSLNHMTALESKLAQTIGDYSLESYSFGYNAAESLYSLEGTVGNTPNSVFPIFWWPRTLGNKKRNTLLTRFERGLK